jgi:LacI family transcriptional regulator
MNTSLYHTNESNAPSRRSITIRDIARLAGVSPGTVSRAVRDSPLVNAKTKERIKQIVSELGYKPNLAARSLVLQRTLTLAVLAAWPPSASESECLAGITEAVVDTEYRLLFRSIQPAPNGHRFDSFPSRSEVDGVLVVSVTPAADELVKLASAEVPVVFLGTNDDSLAQFHQVSGNDRAAGHTAARDLVKLVTRGSV